MTQFKFSFPKGYFQFSKNQHINFHLNRWHSLGYWTKADTYKIGQEIHESNNPQQALVAFAERVKSENRCLETAIGYRAAEFFSHPYEANKNTLYDQFQAYFYQGIESLEYERHLIPFRSGSLPALRLTPENSRGSILIHGGLDSFMEELFTAAYYMFSAGFDVILFDGPGQGAALRKHHLYMTYQWEEPVSAILDYFNLENVTLIGISLGGYLALRAAAFEQRISKVVAFDIFIYDQHGSGLQGALYNFFLKYPSTYDWVARTAMRMSPAADHLISQWMFILGAATPAEYVAQMQFFSVSDIAERVRQDVLLLAGEKDHMIPIGELEKHQQGLINAQSVAARIFTSDEHAENHCQVGNIKMALDVILDWIDSTADL